MFKLAGKVALVTGGNGGIGLAMARGLAQAGAKVVIAGRDAAKSAAAVKALLAEGLQADAVEADVTDEAAVRLLFDTALQRHGALHILVNNAGTSIRKAPQDLSLKEWQTVTDANLTSAFLCSRAAHAPLRQAGGGKVINIGSMLSILGAPYGSVMAPAGAASCS